MACIAIPNSDEMTKLAHKILEAAEGSYTEEQLKEIPRIINTKRRYFWGVDFRDYEVLRNVFTDEGPDGYCAYYNGAGGPLTIDAQIASNKFAIGPDEGVVPTHFGLNQIVYFIDDTHAQLLTRMHDHHVYLDDGETYEGWGFYIDDLIKGADNVWRISVLRLDYCQMDGQLRSVRRQMEQAQS